MQATGTTTSIINLQVQSEANQPRYLVKKQTLWIDSLWSALVGFTVVDGNNPAPSLDHPIVGRSFASMSSGDLTSQIISIASPLPLSVMAVGLVTIASKMLQSQVETFKTLTMRTWDGKVAQNHSSYNIQLIRYHKSRNVYIPIHNGSWLVFRVASPHDYNNILLLELGAVHTL